MHIENANDEFFPAFEHIEKKVKQLFAPESWSEAYATLSSYQNPTRMSTTRIHLAALKSTQGDLNGLRAYLTNSDARDIVANAEYPHQMSCDSWKLPPGERQELREKDRQQYLKWLHNEDA